MFNLRQREGAVVELTERLLSGPIILDPTSLVSARHMQLLRPSPNHFFVSETWARAVAAGDWEEVDNVLWDLSWRFGYRPLTQDPDVRDLVVRSTAQARSYRARSEDLRHLERSYGDGWDFDRVTDRVLGDEYSFVRQHSAIVSRIRRPYHLLRDRGIAILDAGDRLMSAKARLFARHPRFKLLLGVLIPLEALPEGLSLELRIMGVLAQELLAIYDPIPPETNPDDAQAFRR